MILLYLFQGIIHAVFDTRHSPLHKFINSVALIGSIILTARAYGWRLVWLPFVVLFAASIVSGIVTGLVKRSRIS